MHEFNNFKLSHKQELLEILPSTPHKRNYMLLLLILFVLKTKNQEQNFWRIHVVTANDIQQWIEEGMPDARVAVTGDGHHFEAVVVSSAFADKSILVQHRMVYETLGDKMQGAIHALSLRTLTP